MWGDRLTTLVRIGLVVLTALSPALCCCNARWLTSWAAAAPPAACAAAPAPQAAPACPYCCQAADPAPAPVEPGAPAPTPGAPSPHCIFCDGQGSAVVADPAPRPEPPGFTGEMLPVAWCAAVLPVHPARLAGLFPPERAGVDARSAALFDRHVMRC